MNSEAGHLYHQLVQRALELGCGTDPKALPELARLLTLPSAEVRSVAASAIGKLAGFGLDPDEAVCALAPVALYDPNPQARRHALKALKTCGAAARDHLPDLDELALDERTEKPVRRDANAAAEAIREAVRQSGKEAVHRCARCSRPASREEHMRSQLTFQRTFCDVCFDGIFLERRHLDPEV